MEKFTDIGQFRNVIKAVKHEASYAGVDADGNAIYNETYELPTIKFYGTPKAHGTNSGVVMDKDKNLEIVSRNRVLSIGNDNAGFAAFVKKNEDVIREFFTSFELCLKTNDKVAIYGEWCGKGIQKGVAVSELDKRWLIFAVKIVPDKDSEETAYYVSSDGIESPENRIFNMSEFKNYELTIDFTKPETAQNKIIKLVDEVENCCPIGKYFGVTGIGEGIVWTSWVNGKRQYIFKTKGEKHAKGGGPKIKTLKPVNEEFEQKKRDFVNKIACTQSRMTQIYDETFDILNGGEGDIKKTGDYIKAVMQDVIKEESDILVEQELTTKNVTGMIAKVARDYMMDRLNKEAGI